MKSIAQNHFDDEAGHYPVTIGQDYTQRLKWDILSSFASKTSFVADIGAASGRHAVPMAERCAFVLALDLSFEMLSKLSGNASINAPDQNLFPVVAQLPDLPIGTEKFDLVYCFATLLLLPIEQQNVAIEQMVAALKPGGRLVLDLANRRSLGIHYWRRYYQKRGMAGIFGYGLSEVYSLLARLGLNVDAIHPQGALSQLLLAPGVARVPGVNVAIRGGDGKPGWDDAVSRRFPSLAERWYVVAHRPGDEKARGNR